MEIVLLNNMLFLVAKEDFELLTAIESSLYGSYSKEGKDELDKAIDDIISRSKCLHERFTVFNCFSNLTCKGESEKEIPF